MTRFIPRKRGIGKKFSTPPTLHKWKTRGTQKFRRLRIVRVDDWKAVLFFASHSQWERKKEKVAILSGHQKVFPLFVFGVTFWLPKTILKRVTIFIINFLYFINVTEKLRAGPQAKNKCGLLLLGSNATSYNLLETCFQGRKGESGICLPCLLWEEMKEILSALPNISFSYFIAVPKQTLGPASMHSPS